MDDVDAVVGERHLLGGAGQHPHVLVAAGPPAGEGHQVGVRLHADHLARRRGEQRQVEPGAAAEVEHARVVPGAIAGDGLA